MDGEPGEGLHPLLARRWSPRAFDPAHDVDEAEVDLLLEAARWAPSAGNSQPWAFVTARRGTPEHGRVVARLAGSTRAWAPTASLLVLNLAHRYVEDSDLEYSEFALYDLGQAVAHLTVQGEAIGLSARQFRAFDQEGLEEDFAVGSGWELVSMTALGRALPVDEATGPSSRQPRRPLDDLRWSVTDR